MVSLNFNFMHAKFTILSLSAMLFVSGFFGNYSNIEEKSVSLLTIVEGEPENMKGITARHNYYRAEVGLPPLEWSGELAAYAQEWANELKKRGCKIEHRPGSGKWEQIYGENIYWSMGIENKPADVVDDWGAEKENFDYNKYNLGRGVGHYTQIIWEKTTKIGCAMVKCGDQEVWVCNYDPPGNVIGQKPYGNKQTNGSVDDNQNKGNQIEVLNLFKKSKISVNAFTKCWAALISAEEAEGMEYGWWSAWQKIKENKKYQQTPCDFKNIKPGKYTLVVYNPASVDFDPNNGNPDEASDGVVMEEIEIKANTNLKYNFGKADFKDWNCLSCPWLYVFDGKEYVRTTEILKDVVGEKTRRKTTFELKTTDLMDGKLKIRIQEEKDEITHLDQLLLKVNGKVYAACQTNGAIKEELTVSDNRFVILKKGESIDIEFSVPEKLAPGTEIILESEGYYIPDKEFLRAVYLKYLHQSTK